MAEQDKPFDEQDVYVAGPDAYDDDFVEPPRWPKVVGIISICWGGLGLCCNGLGAVWFVLGPRMIGTAAQQMPGGMPPVILSPPPSQTVLAVLSAVLSVLLIVAGAVATARRPMSRVLHLVYSVLAMILAFAGAYVSLEIQAEIAEWVKANPDAQFSQSQRQGGVAGQVIGLAFGLILGFAWPLFCIVWFGFVKRKPDDMTGGVIEPAA